MLADEPLDRPMNFGLNFYLIVLNGSFMLAKTLNIRLYSCNISSESNLMRTSKIFLVTLLLNLHFSSFADFGLSTRKLFDPLDIFTGDIPQVENVTTSLNTINQSNFGQQWIVVAEYSIPMNIMVQPALNFVNQDAENVLNFNSGLWLTDSTFTWVFDIETAYLSLGMTTFTLEDGISEEGEAQVAYSVQNQLYIDTQAPGVLFSQSNTNTIIAPTQSICVNIIFNEPMQSTLPNFTWSSPDFNATNALIFNPNGSSWISTHTYTACFNVLSGIFTGASNLGLQVHGALDANGNMMTSFSQENYISWQTTLPIMTLSASTNLLTTNQIGENAIGFTLTANMPMNTSIFPTLSFIVGTNPITQLVLNPISSLWTSATSCYMSYDLSDSPIGNVGVGVNVSNFTNAIGNPPNQISFPNVFNIDTKKPTANSVNSLYDFANDLSVNANNFFMDINFSEPMSHAQTNFPLVEVRTSNGEPVPGISYDVDGSYWQNDATLRAFFNLIDLNIEVIPLFLYVENAADDQGNVMIPDTEGSSIFIDTKNPSLLSVEFSVPQINSNTSNVVITSTFDEPMNPSLIPQYQTIGSFGSQNMLTHNAGQGFWLNNNTYQGTYLVTPFSYEGLINLKPMVARDMRVNIVQDTILLNIIEVDFMNLGINELPGSTLAIYPNPIHRDQVIHVKMTEFETDMIQDIVIIDCTGRTISPDNVRFLSQDTLEIQTRFLSAGLYQLLIQGRNFRQNVKFSVTN